MQAGEEEEEAAKQDVLRRLQAESQQLPHIDAAAIWQRTQTLLDLLYTRVRTCRESHEQSHEQLRHFHREQEKERAQRKTFMVRGLSGLGVVGASALLAAHLSRRRRNRSQR